VLERIDVKDNGVCPVDVAGCLDVDHCATGAARRAAEKPLPAVKRAFVLVEPLQLPPGQRFLGVAGMRAALGEAKLCEADVVWVVPSDNVATHPLTSAERKVLESHGFVVHEAPWVTPPGGGGTLACGGRSLLGLHALGLDGYSSVVLLGDGLIVRREAASLFGCAPAQTPDGSAPSRLLHAIRAGTGVLALRPSRDLLEAAVRASATLRLEDRGAVGANSTDCGVEFAVAALCGVSSVKTGTWMPSCHAIDPCKWSRVPSDSTSCSALHIPCESSRVALASTC
jgi:hypothetical protein